jgi:hypothetical protein
MHTGLPSLDGAKGEEFGDGSDVLLAARGIARGVIGGAIIWAVLLISSIALLSL